MRQLARRESSSQRARGAVATAAAALLAAAAVMLSAAPARAQGASEGKEGATTTTSSVDIVKPAKDSSILPPWMKKLEGSYAELSTFSGTGSFYASGYRDPYISLALFVRPTYDLGTRFKLSANARVYIEEELTQPDNPTGRHFNPYDIWLWLSAKQLHLFERAKVKLGGSARLVLPLSWESRYQNLLFGVAAGPGLSREFILGDASVERPRRWTLTVALAGMFTKYLHTSDLRGSSPGDTTGCRTFVDAGTAAAGTGVNGTPAGAESDRCGGPVNTSFSVTTTANATLGHGKWTASLAMIVLNGFRYSIPDDAYTAIPADSRGRYDTTWGIVSVGYNITDHVGLSAGMSSYQPALDSRNQHLRFPFFDLSGGGNANNYTQFFAGVNGTL